MAGTRMIHFSALLNQRRYEQLADFLTECQERNGSMQWEAPGDDTYLAWFYDDQEVHVIVIPFSDVETTDAFDAIKSRGNKANNTRSSAGALRVAATKPSGLRANFFSHNWCDRTTWYQQSIRVEAEQAVDSGDHKTFTLGHQGVIDAYHGKLTQEDFLLDADGNSYRISVTVDGAPVTEQDPHFGAGGDFVVDYASGLVVFVSELPANSVVASTYHYATTSVFTFGPGPGSTIELDMAEVQFATDVELRDTMRYNVFGYASVFAPGLGLPAGTKIPLAQDTVYKTMSDYYNDAVRSFPSYPALGGSGWRGLTVPCTVLDWNYLRSVALSSAAGMEIRIWLEHDEPLGGSYSAATFYCGTGTE